MKSLKCSDLGNNECGFEANGENNQEVVEKMFKHAQEVHSDKLAGMSEEEKQKMTGIMNEILDKQA